jgi:predicted peptidase
MFLKGHIGVNIKMFFLLSMVLLTIVFSIFWVNRFKFITKSFEYKRATDSLLYRLYVPKENLIKDKIPLVLVLHSLGECGSDNRKQLNWLSNEFLSGTTQKKYPSIVFMPQCPIGVQWVNTNFTKTPFGHYVQSNIPESIQIKMIMAVISELKQKYPIDSRRIYVVGSSMGASGTWDILTRYPDVFSAAIIISGVSDTTVASKIVHIPIRVYHGRHDNVAPVQLNINMTNAVNSAGGRCNLKIYENAGHNIGEMVIKEPQLLDWLFSQVAEK